MVPTSFSVPENLSDYLQSAPLPSFPAKLARRPSGKENHQQSLRLKLKSPDLVETSFIMSTIEEEIEGVNMSQTSQELISLSQGGSQELIDLASEPPAAARGPPEPLAGGPTRQEVLEERCQTTAVGQGKGGGEEAKVIGRQPAVSPPTVKQPSALSPSAVNLPPQQAALTPTVVSLPPSEPAHNVNC